nr:hypothetical protein [Neorhizobium tomejilense]
METKGGYDTGCWFVFSGKLVGALDLENRIVGGRLLSRRGFCSEGMMQSRAEQFSRGGKHHGIALFLARVEAREAQLTRWLAEYNDGVNKKEKLR